MSPEDQYNDPPGPTRPETRHRETCGTNAGYNAHTARLEKPCQPCTIARSKYTREWRARRRAEGNPVSKDRQLARGRALARLGRRYRRELEELVQEELAKGKTKRD